MTKVNEITRDNATSLLIAQTITSDQFDAFWLAELDKREAEGRAAGEAAASGKVHYGVTAGGGINLRGVPGSPGGFGMTLYSATVRWLATNIDDVVAHAEAFADEDFTRGSDGRIVRVTADKDGSQAQKARCTAEIARWILAAEDHDAAGFELDEEWAAGMAEDHPEMGGVYPHKKLAGLIKAGKYSDEMKAAIKVARKAADHAEAEAAEAADDADDEIERDDK